jgi:hypothetical protein
MLGEQVRREDETRCQDTERNWKEAVNPTPHTLILDLLQHRERAQSSRLGMDRSRRRPHRHGKLGHRFSDEELARVPGKPARSGVGFLAARAVGAYAGAGIHLAVKLGEKDEGDPGAQRRRAIRTPPDRGKAVEAIPYPLGPVADFL